MSIAVTSSYTTFVPNFSACSRISSMRSGPMIPLGKPGKFSTSVVFVSSPPGSTDDATSTGSRFARAV